MPIAPLVLHFICEQSLYTDYCCHLWV